MDNYRIYIGTYSGDGSEGIYAHKLDMSTGALTQMSSHGEIENPSFLDLSPDGRFLYAIGEVSETNGQPGGTVGAYSINQEDGSLKYINTESTV